MSGGSSDLRAAFLGAAMGLLCFGSAMAQSPAPRQPASGPGSISGVWVSTIFDENFGKIGIGNIAASNRQARLGPDGKPVGILPWAQAIMDRRAKEAAGGHPFAEPKARCLPTGTPGSMSPPPPLLMQLIESPGQITVLFEEFNVFRIIRMSDKHDPDFAPGYFGDSIAHWEGDTLVVDTVGLNEESSIGGVPHSPDLHVVERIRRKGPILEMVRTYDDPKTFTAPWTNTATMKQLPGAHIMEYFCDHDRNRPDENGGTTVALPGRGSAPRSGSVTSR